MKAVISVIGTDTVGIMANVSQVCCENNCNIIDVTQKVLQDYFTMIMIVEIDNCKVSFAELSDQLAKVGENMGLSIHTMHEDIFNSMHRI
jgi:ACT domain-containing protein